jgi:transposase
MNRNTKNKQNATKIDNSQNAKIRAITETTMIVGIDVGSEKHDARAFTYRGIEISDEPLEFSNSEEGFETFYAWMEDLRSKNGLDAVMPVMEPTGHYWFNLGAYLQDHGMKPVLVNPYHVKQSKELDDNNPLKTDRKDPKVIAGLVKDGRYIIPYIPEGVYAEVRNLTNLRYQATEALTRVKNRFARWTSLYFPELKDVYKQPGAVTAMMVLHEAPLPADIVKLGVDGILKIWREHKVHGAGEKRARKLVEAAEHSIGSKNSPEAAKIELQELLEDYEKYDTRVNELIELIDKKIAEIPNVDKILAIPGIGKRTAYGFVAEVGDIGRFDDPKQLQKLAGFAIVEDSSGKHKGESHISYRGRKRLRYVLYEGAVSLVARNAQFKELYKYYRTRKDNPLKKMQALIAVACKLIRVFYKILTTGVDYNGTKMLGDIRRTDEDRLALTA